MGSHCRRSIALRSRRDDTTKRRKNKGNLLNFSNSTHYSFLSAASAFWIKIRVSRIRSFLFFFWFVSHSPRVCLSLESSLLIISFASPPKRFTRQPSRPPSCFLTIPGLSQRRAEAHKCGVAVQICLFSSSTEDILRVRSGKWAFQFQTDKTSARRGFPWSTLGSEGTDSTQFNIPSSRNTPPLHAQTHTHTRALTKESRTVEAWASQDHFVVLGPCKWKKSRLIFVTTAHTKAGTSQWGEKLSRLSPAY